MSARPCTCRYVQQTLESGTDTELLTGKAALLEQLQELKDRECKLEPETDEQLLVDTNTTLVEEAVAAAGAVRVVDVDVAQCTVAGEGVDAASIRVSTPMEFEVTLKDAEGTCACVCAQPVWVSVSVSVSACLPACAYCAGVARQSHTAGEHAATHSAAEALSVTSGEVEMEVNDTGNGTYRCCYIVNERHVGGRVTIDVTVRQTHVEGSPFTLDVLPKRT